MKKERSPRPYRSEKQTNYREITVIIRRQHAPFSVPQLACAALPATALLLSACHREKAEADSYGPGKIELNSPPAKITNERHTGPFAEGAALNMTAELKPLD